MVLLKVFFSHLSLNDHQTCVYEGLLKQLALKHADKVFNSDVFTRWAFYDPSVCLNLLLSRQRLLWISLALLYQGLLVLVKQLC
jgi:hypothetical protein